VDAAPIVPASPEVLHFFEEYSGFLILGHREPDGDCVGSQLALGSALERAGKRVVVANPGPFERPEIAPFAADFATTVDIGPLGSRPAAIVLDCSSADRLAVLAESTRDLPILVIDHHASGAVFGDVHFIDPHIPATTILVATLISQLGYTVTPREAFLLFLGLVTDTGFFRFLGAGETTAFRTATALSEAGASPREIDFHIRNGRSFESRKLISRMLDRVERLRDGRILLTYQTQADERELGSRRDSDALNSLLLAIEDVEMIAVAKEKPEGCTVSFRATSEIDVGELATEFGGGGHKKASGAFVSDNLDTFLTRLRARLNAVA
jgi:phosphoesterase RecJ-like protein